MASLIAKVSLQSHLLRDQVIMPKLVETTIGRVCIHYTYGLFNNCLYNDLSKKNYHPHLERRLSPPPGAKKN